MRKGSILRWLARRPRWLPARRPIAYAALALALIGAAFASGQGLAGTYDAAGAQWPARTPAARASTVRASTAGASTAHAGTVAAQTQAQGAVSFASEDFGVARGARPCDIYAAGGTPCVAAYSTTRAVPLVSRAALPDHAGF